MVYLDAFLPESGQSLWDLLGSEGAERQRIAAEKYDGGKSLPPFFLYPQAAAPRPAPYFTAQPIKTVSQSFVSGRSQATWPPRRYICCRNTPTPVFRMTAARLKDAPGWTDEEFDAAHDVALTHPDLVAKTIAGMAARCGVAGA